MRFLQIRRARSVCQLALALSFLPYLVAVGSAQTLTAGLRVGAVAGVASGEAPTVAAGLQGSLPIGSNVAVHAEYLLRTRSFAPCWDGWPDSYICNVHGQSLLTGLRYDFRPAELPFSLFVDAMAGVFRRGEVASDAPATSPAYSIGTGVHFPVVHRIAVEPRVSWTVIDDGAYVARIGNPIRYRTYQLALVLGVRRGGR